MKMHPLDQKIREWRDATAAVMGTLGEPMFLGKPESWFEDLRWFCRNGHVSRTILKCEEEGDQCLECFAPVQMGPPITEADFAEILVDLKRAVALESK